MIYNENSSSSNKNDQLLRIHLCVWVITRMNRHCAEPFINGIIKTPMMPSRGSHSSSAWRVLMPAPLGRGGSRGLDQRKALCPRPPVCKRRGVDRNLTADAIARVPSAWFTTMRRHTEMGTSGGIMKSCAYHGSRSRTGSVSHLAQSRWLAGPPKP